MSKWIVFIALVLVFNVVMGVGFVWASIDIINRINSGDLTAVLGNLLYIEIVHPVIIDGFLTYPPTSPSNVIPNYPFILFWLSMLGNLGFIAYAVVLKNKESKHKPLEK